jgi:hypothetical protein
MKVKSSMATLQECIVVHNWMVIVYPKGGDPYVHTSYMRRDIESAVKHFRSIGFGVSPITNILH